MSVNIKKRALEYKHQQVARMAVLIGQSTCVFQSKLPASMGNIIVHFLNANTTKKSTPLCLQLTVSTSISKESACEREKGSSQKKWPILVFFFFF